jgi:hypothetical protein
MKTNGKHEVIAGIARQSLVLVALLAMVLSTASISHAQSSATSAAVPAAKTVAAPAKAAASPIAKPGAKGSHEGITVHGHWIIEVKNPDGKVANRVEFENSLCTTQALTAGGGTLFLVGGDQLLTQLLSGQYYQMWTVQLLPPASGTGTPCVQGTLGTFPFLLTSGTDSAYGAGCQEPQNGVYEAATVGEVCTGLSVSAQNSPPGLMLSGTLTALPSDSWFSYPVTIGVVSTNLALAVLAGDMDIYYVYSRPCSIVCGTFTAASLPSPGITIQQGQSVSVTVNFTFGSPS